MPRYSSRTARALGFLKRSVNDIEIFVEDTSNRNMWVRLLTQVLPPGVRLRSINMLGGRKAVEDACAADQSEDGRRKLFITDGDFDHLTGKSKPRLKFLYRLRSYCVENILVSERAITYIAMETDPMISDTVARAKFDFKSFSDDISRNLKSLFELYAVCIKLCPSLRTVSYPVVDLCTRSANGELVLDGALVAARKRALKRAMLGLVARSEIRSHLLSTRARSSAISAMRSVSGKDYIFPLLENRMRIRLGFKGNSEQLKVRLAGHFERAMEPYFGRRVAAI